MTYEEYASMRDKLGVKDSEIAKQTEIPQSTFSDWKNKRSKPKEDKMNRITEYFKKHGINPNESTASLSIDKIEVYMQSLDSNRLERIKAYADYLIKRNSDES